MRTFPAVFFLLLLASFAHAGEYAAYDLKSLLTTSETPSGARHGFNVTYLDRMLDDLYRHAKDAPARFDTPQERERALRDVTALSKMLDILIAGEKADPELLRRAALLNLIGHNMGIAGADSRADAIYRRLLAAEPLDPQGNYMYGTFLAGERKAKEALPYLEKALSLGVLDATFTIAVVHLILGNKEKAVANLEAYKRRHPDDGDIAQIIDVIRSDRLNTDLVISPK